MILGPVLQYMRTPGSKIVFPPLSVSRLLVQIFNTGWIQWTYKSFMTNN
jgi:hypothetical protein